MTLVSDCIKHITQTPLTDPQDVFMTGSEIVDLAYLATREQMAFWT